MQPLHSPAVQALLISYEGVRLGVHSAGRIVQNEYFRFLQQSAGDTEPLFLPAGLIAG